MYNGLMVAFGHTAVGVIVGVTTYQVIGQFDIASGLITSGLAGVISHYLMDLIPHGHFFREKDYNKYINWVIIFDLLIPTLFFLVLAHILGKNPVEILYILFSVGGAQLPDTLVGLGKLDLLPDYKIFKTEYKFHISTHWHGQKEHSVLFNIKDLWQVLMFLLAILILVRS